MGGVVAGATRAPLTATFFAVELSGNTHIMLPLLTASVAAFALTVLVMKRSILTEATMPIADAVAFFTSPEGPARYKSYPVVDEKGKPVWMVSRAAILRWSREGWAPGATLLDCADDVMLGYADELVGQLADRMAVADVGRVPIIERQSGQMVGLVARRDLLRVRTRVRVEEQHRSKMLHVRK